MERRCRIDVDTFVAHTLPLPRCCPISGNPVPGSKITIAYRPVKGVVFPVEDLEQVIDEYVGGHSSGVREMESMIQELALRVAKEVDASVRVSADLLIDPPYGGQRQKMRVSAKVRRP